MHEKETTRLDLDNNNNNTQHKSLIVVLYWFMFMARGRAQKGTSSYLPGSSKSAALLQMYLSEADLPRVPDRGVHMYHIAYAGLVLLLRPISISAPRTT